MECTDLWEINTKGIRKNGLMSANILKMVPGDKTLCTKTGNFSLILRLFPKSKSKVNKYKR